MSATARKEAEISEREERALEVIGRDDGIHQSEFWKEMDVTSRTGSRIINKLREKGLVEREEAVHEGRKTYYITLVQRKEDLDFSLLMAGDSLSPFVAEEELDPQSDAFSQWLMELAYEEY